MNAILSPVAGPIPVAIITHQRRPVAPATAIASLGRRIVAPMIPNNTPSLKKLAMLIGCDADSRNSFGLHSMRCDDSHSKYVRQRRRST